MISRLLIVLAIVSTAVALLAGDRVAASMPVPSITLSTAPGVSVPQPADLAASLQNQFRVPAGTQIYALKNDKWVEVKPESNARHLNAVVRSYDPADGVAYLHLASPEYPMPL